MSLKRYSLGFMIALLLAFSFPSISYAEDVYYLRETFSGHLPCVGSVAYLVVDTNILDSPDGDIIGRAEKCTSTQILGYDPECIWAKTRVGWLYAGYLSKAMPTPITIETDSDECDIYIGYTNYIISKIPEPVLEGLDRAGYKFALTLSDIGSDNMYYDGADCADTTGITVYTEDWCESYVEAEPIYILYSTVHEIGHALSWLLGEPCLGPEFQYCFEEEGGYADTEHHSENEQEFFASCFRDYIEIGEDAFYMRPASYEYMDRLLSEYI